MFTQSGSPWLARSVAVGSLLDRLLLPSSARGRVPDDVAALRLRPLFIALSVGWTLVLAGLALTPELALPVNDKVLHALGTALFTVTFYPVFLPAPTPPWATRLPLMATAIAGGPIMSVGSEFAQASLSSRGFDWKDVLANLCGFAVALGLAHRFLPKRFVSNPDGDYV